MIDSYSRWLLACEVLADQTSETVERVLEAVFQRYGPPRLVITDNARCFAPAQADQHHRVARFMAEHGVEHRLRKPYYPQTNGKAEAMVKTFKRACLRPLGAHWSWSDVVGCVEAFRAWYNFYRSHGAISYRVPSQRYAGVELPRRGLESIFGFLPESVLALDQVPEITARCRIDRLALVPVS